MPAAGGKTLTKWPMLREGDGGAAVHGLQVALDRMGFNPGREDMQWWQFGDTTYGALQTMQVCCFPYLSVLTAHINLVDSLGFGPTIPVPP